MSAQNTGNCAKASLRTRHHALWALGFIGCLLYGGRPVAGAEAPLANPPGAKTATRTLLFFGDSLTAGYGLDDPADEAFPGLIQKKLDGARLPWRVVNAGLSGETSSGGLRRIDWFLRQPIDGFVLALGANDGLRGIEPELTRTNLAKIIARVREKNPGVLLVVAGMQMPPNLGPEYPRDFAGIFPAVAKQAPATLVPFLLEGVAGQPELNQPDGIHPTAEGHRKVAETVWAHLLPLL